jgi:hypothetical protein
MSVEQQVDALTASVEDLKGAVVSKKATLDASVADAQSATAQAQSAKANALSARDQAGAFKDAAYSAAQSAASAVAYQDLSAVALTKAVTAVDVFIYDTSKDSDGGAWRHRCAGTSWYREPLNTATRGARREFPAVVVIVATADTVTIYDGDDPSLPMWMVVSGGSDKFFNTAGGGSITAISAKNGWLVGTSSTRSVSRLNFLTEEAYTGVGFGSYKVTAPIATFRNALVFPTYTVPPSLFSIASSIAYDLAMTVLPSASIDPATGLPVPTIAVATAGGVSVIKDDGAVVDATFVGSRNYISKVDFTADNWVFATTSNVTNPIGWFPVLFEIPSADVTNLGTSTGGKGVGFTFLDAPYINTTQYEAGTDAVASDETLFVGKTVGFWQIQAVPDDTLAVMRNNMVSKITATYNTGWMNGAIRGAFLADTNDTDLVEAEFSDDFSGYSDQAAMQSAGYSFANSAFDAALDTVVFSGSVSGDITLSSATLTAAGLAAGDAFEVAVVVTGLVAGSLSVQDNFVSIGAFSTEGTHIFRGTRAGNFRFVTANGFEGEIQSITFRKLDRDRSVKNSGLVVNGAITRAPVSTGAELVAYSGFSASNFLEQPYNSELDFGTDDFCSMGWFYDSSVNGAAILTRNDGVGVEANYGPGSVNIFSNAGLVKLRLGNSLALNHAMPLGSLRWVHVVALRRSGIAELWVDGVLRASSGNSENLTLGGGALRFGQYFYSQTFSAIGGTILALWRISATAPTADQIRRIYKDEKALFQENAACTLFGASDAVTALAHDPDTGLLHVGTSAGRSVFKGLRRVANTTTPVATAIAAAGKLVVEQ